MNSTARLAGLVAAATIALTGTAATTAHAQDHQQGPVARVQSTQAANVLTTPLSTTELTGLAAMALGTVAGLASTATRRRSHGERTA